MLVNSDFKFIFLHIQKCGGRYINKELVKIPGTYLEHGQFAHNSIQTINPRIIEGWFKFTTLRDPLSWYVSFHNFHKQRVEHGIEGWAEEFIDYTTLDEWIIKFINCEVDMSGLAALRDRSEGLAPSFNFEYCLNDFRLNAYGKFTYYSFYLCSRRHDDLFNSCLDVETFPDYYEVDKIFDIHAFDRIGEYLPTSLTSKPSEITLREVDRLSQETRDFVHAKDRLIYDHFYSDHPHEKMVLNEVTAGL